MGKKPGQGRPLKGKDTNAKATMANATAANAFKGKKIDAKNTDAKVAVGKDVTGKNNNGNATNGKVIVGNNINGRETDGKDTNSKHANDKLVHGKLANASATNARAIRPDRSQQLKFTKVFPFLKLPAELRIKIYNYSFGKHVLEILPLTKYSGLTSWNPRGRKPRPSLRNANPLATRGRSSRPGRADTRLSKWPKIESRPGLAALLLTCKQIHRETHHLLYEQVTFIICSQTVLARFLTNLSPPCLAAIRTLKLQHHTFGEPYLMENKVWKEKYDLKWAALCLEAGKKMTGLKELEVKLGICDWPTELNLQTRWALPLLAFAGGKLEKAKVQLLMNGRCVEWQALRACAAILERELVVQKNRLDAGFSRGGLSKAVRCLRIT